MEGTEPSPADGGVGAPRASAWQRAREARFDEIGWVIDEYLAPPPAAVPTGVAALDRWFSGGLRPGANVIVADPGAGKSALGCHIALSNALAGRRVCVLSLEMTSAATWLRMASELSATEGGGLEPFSWGDSETIRRETHRRMASGEWTAADALHGDPLLAASDALWRRCPGLAVSDLRGETDVAVVQAEIRELADAGAELLVIDYMQRMTAPGGGRYEQLTNASSGLMVALRAAGVPAVVLSSTSREASRGGGPALRSADGTGAIEYDAESVWRITRDPDAADEEARSSSENNPCRVIDVEVAKNRHGATTPTDRPLRVRWWPRTNSFR